MTTTLEPSFLQAAMLVNAFKGDRMKAAQAAMIYRALTHPEVVATDIPETITEGDAHISGCASGALVSIKLLEAVGRVKSPDPAAKGRKLNIYRIPHDRIGAARAWLRANNLPEAQAQTELRLSA
jgi:hypothetical protein